MPRGPSASRRRSKVVPLAEAVDVVQPGCRLCLGGVMNVNRPAAFVRELIRREVGDLLMYSSPGSAWDIDLLVGCGLVRETFIPMMTFGRKGLAPNFRLAAETGQIVAHNMDAMSLMAAYLAGSYHHPYHLVLSIDGTDLVDDPNRFVELTDPDGNRFRAVRAINPDVLVLHVEEGDEFGNLRHLRGRVSDIVMARASSVVIAQVDRLIPHEDVLARPELTTLAARWVDMVVEAPFGAHPTATALYTADDEHLDEYLRAGHARRAGDEAPFADYMARYITAPKDLGSYYELVGGDDLRRRLEGDLHG